MNKLKKCQVCKAYTLAQTHCNQPTTDAHYKFVKIKTENGRSPNKES